MVNNGNWTEWSTIWSGITRVILDRNCTTRSSTTTWLHPSWNRKIQPLLFIIFLVCINILLIQLIFLLIALWLVQKTCATLSTNHMQTKIKHDLVALVFPRSRQFDWFYFEFSLALKGISLSSDWPLYLHWFWLFDYSSKSTLGRVSLRFSRFWLRVLIGSWLYRSFPILFSRFRFFGFAFSELYQKRSKSRFTAL